MATTTEKMQLEFTAKGITQAQGQINGLNAALTSMAAKIGIIAVAYAAMKASMAAVNAAAKFESLEMRLTNLYQSAAKASDVFAKFQKMAVETPFELTNIVEAGSQLKAFGVDAESTLQSITDLAAYMGMDVVEAANSVGRAFAGGVGAADILRERGVLNLIRDFNGIKDLTKLTLPQFRKAMLDTFVNPAAGIAGAGKRMMSTYEGAISNLKDSFTVFKASIGEMFLPSIDSAVRGLTKFIDMLKNSYLGYKQFITGIKSDNILVLEADLKALRDQFDAGEHRWIEMLNPKTGEFEMTQKRTALGEKELRLMQALLEAKAKKIELDKYEANKAGDKKGGAISEEELKRLEAYSKWLFGIKQNMSQMLSIPSQGGMSDADYAKMVDIYNRLNDSTMSEKLKATGETMSAFPEITKDAMEGLDELSDSLTQAEQAWVDFGESMKSMIENQLGNALFTMLMSHASAAEKLKEIWHDLANAVISEITRMIAKMAVMTAFNAIGGGGNIFSIGANLFDFVGGLFNSTTGSRNNTASQNITPIGERSISREIRAGFAGISNNQQPIQVYVNPRDISRAAEIGTTLRYA